MMIKLFGAYISDTVHHDIQASFHYPPSQPMQGLHHLPVLKLEKNQNDQKPQKGLSALAEIAHLRGRKTQLSDESHEQKYEYLSLEIPRNPSEQVRVYGCSLSVGVRYSMRAELTLSILRAVATLLPRSIGCDEQSRFDSLLKQANDLLRDFSSSAKNSRKRHTCRALIKVLQRLEAQHRQTEKKNRQCSKVDH